MHTFLLDCGDQCTQEILGTALAIAQGMESDLAATNLDSRIISVIRQLGEAAALNMADKPQMVEGALFGMIGLALHYLRSKHTPAIDFSEEGGA